MCDGYDASTIPQEKMMPDGLEGLSEREKEALRLLSRGFDVKSIAQSLSITVHAVNERLRSARRKTNAGSSRELARMLADAERHPPTYKLSVSNFSGIAALPPAAEKSSVLDPQATDGAGSGHGGDDGQMAAIILPVQSTSHDPLSAPTKRLPNRNLLTKRQRLYAILEAAIKIVSIFALICLTILLLDYSVREFNLNDLKNVPNLSNSNRSN